MQRLYWNTVNGLLRNVLETTMQRPEFSEFRLVGGTALSLQLGHRLNAMKLEVVSKKGRKKDFWDLHALAEHYDLRSMIGFHKEKYPYGHDEELIHARLTDFESADEDIDPHCLFGKHWEVIKLDLQSWHKTQTLLKKTLSGERVSIRRHSVPAFR